MADHAGLRFAPFLDDLKNGLENSFGVAFIGGKHGSVLDVIKAALFRVLKLQDYGAACQTVLVPQGSAEVFELVRASEVDPPGGLHEAGIRPALQEFVPLLPRAERGRISMLGFWNRLLARFGRGMAICQSLICIRV